MLIANSLCIIFEENVKNCIWKSTEGISFSMCMALLVLNRFDHCKDKQCKNCFQLSAEKQELWHAKVRVCKCVKIRHVCPDLIKHLDAFTNFCML